MIPAGYKGREQAYIKHTLLKHYLERLFMIIGQHARSICYIDCFAGPWQEDSSDLTDTSIGIALDIITKCKNSLHKMSKDVKFRALFVEENQKSYNKLDVFLKSGKWSNIETLAMHGDFYKLRNNICDWCNDDSFAFFFIDPTGWKEVIEIETLRPLLQRKNSEYLINFMFYSILRTHTQAAFQEHMRKIFGEIPDTKNMNSQERELYITNLYLRRLKSAQSHDHSKPRLAYVKVLYPLRDRTKYNLVYLTRHPLGIKVFMEESEKLEIIQKKVRVEAKIDYRTEKTGQTDLFGKHEPSIIIHDDNFSLEAVKEYWLQKLSATPKLFGLVELADMLEETGWFISNFQLAFKELEDNGKVKNLDSSRRRPKNVVDFLSNNNLGERLVRL
jgi:three-Cys-motif partner protein